MSTFLQRTLLIAIAFAALVFGGTRLLPASAQPEPPPVRPTREAWLADGAAPLARLPESAGRQAAAAAYPKLATLPDWTRIVYQSARDGNWELYITSGPGAYPTRLTVTGEAEVYPRLNRGATKIVFSTNRAGNFEIAVRSVDNPAASRLTFNDTSDYDPAWSPDGTRIAFDSYRDGQSEVYVMNADGSGQTRLTYDAAYDGMVAWSPDSSKLAFASTRGGSDPRIWVMNADGSGLRQLSTQRLSQHPAWSPDGAQIAFDADGNGDSWLELLADERRRQQPAPGVRPAGRPNRRPRAELVA